MLDDELGTICDRYERDCDEAIVEFSVGLHQCVIRSNGLVEALLSFAVLLKYLRPGRSDEDRLVVAKFLGSVPDVVGDRNADQTEIADDIGNSAVEEDGASGLFSDAVGAHLPGEHKFCKKGPILPR